MIKNCCRECHFLEMNPKTTFCKYSGLNFVEKLVNIHQHGCEKFMDRKRKCEEEYMSNEYVIEEKVKIAKRKGGIEPFDGEKIKNALKITCTRVFDENHKMFHLTESQLDSIVDNVKYIIDQNHSMALEMEEEVIIPIDILHVIIETSIKEDYPKLCEEYMKYKGYKATFVEMGDNVYNYKLKLERLGDRSNANTDGALVTTKRSLVYSELNKEYYKKFFLNKEELDSIMDGYIYIHDIGARLDTFNCCIFDLENLLSGGFNMGNHFHKEPNGLEAAFRLIGDIILSSAAMQYGGWSCSEIDKILSKYAEKTYTYLVNEMRNDYTDFSEVDTISIPENIEKMIHEKVMKKIRKIFEQGFQSFEMKFNSIASSRGDYPFIAFSFGLDTNEFSVMATSAILKVRREGQGEDGKKRPVLFPKLNFLYHEDIHGPGKEYNHILKEAVLCSSKAMYPDYLSLSGNGYVADMYKQYGKLIVPMGCRANLPKWFERGGLTPADDQDELVTTGRFNLGAISLHLPMILAKSREENKDFYEVLTHYMNIARHVHQKTIEFLGQLKASSNPLGFCEGGLYGGNLQPHEKIRPILQNSSLTFAVTALNEMQYLYNGKHIHEDSDFAYEVMTFINDLITKFKDEDNLNYSSPYGTPAESLCGLQVQQFRKKYGVIEGVSDRDYVSNSFHCPVWADITITEKQDYEERFWDKFNGGKIQYGRYNNPDNLEAIETLVHRGMKKGFYQGVNISLSYCGNCGLDQSDMGETCPKCGSSDITQIDRMNGYLGYTRVAGDSRYNDAKLVEIHERKSM